MKEENWHNHLQETFQDFAPEPEIDLWPGIESEIRPKTKVVWLPYALLAAAAAIALLFFWKSGQPEAEGIAVEEGQIVQVETHGAEKLPVVKDSTLKKNQEVDEQLPEPSKQIKAEQSLAEVSNQTISPPAQFAQQAEEEVLAKQFSIASIEVVNAYAFAAPSPVIPFARPISRLAGKGNNPPKNSRKPDLDLTNPQAFQFLAFASNKLQPFRRFVPLRVKEQRSSNKEFRLLFIKIKGLEFSRKKYVPNIQKHD